MGRDRGGFVKGRARIVDGLGVAVAVAVVVEAAAVAMVAVMAAEEEVVEELGSMAMAVVARKFGIFGALCVFENQMDFG